MTIIKITPNDNGSHDNQTIYGVMPATFPVPEGWSLVPEDLETPNFPFGEVEVEERQYIVEVEGAEPITIPYTAVNSWTPLPMPEPGPMPEPEPTQLDRVEAQVTYTAMMTDTLLEV